MDNIHKPEPSKDEMIYALQALVSKLEQQLLLVKGSERIDWLLKMANEIRDKTIEDVMRVVKKTVKENPELLAEIIIQKDAP